MSQDTDRSPRHSVNTKGEKMATKYYVPAPEITWTKGPKGNYLKTVTYVKFDTLKDACAYAMALVRAKICDGVKHQTIWVPAGKGLKYYGSVYLEWVVPSGDMGPFLYTGSSRTGGFLNPDGSKKRY